MKITKFEFIEHIVPNTSCGTGYSEPYKFWMETSNNIRTYVYIDNWYDSIDIYNIIYSSIKTAINEYIKNVNGNTSSLDLNIDNIEEIYNKCKDIIVVNNKI